MIARLLATHRRRSEEGGFALVFVLLVTTMVMIGVGAALAAVVPNIGASKRSEDSMAAMAAARSGVDDLIAYLVSVPSCRSETKICPAALGATSTALNGTPRQRPSLGTGQSFVWKTNPNVTADGYLRVTSTGTSNGTTRKLTADLSLQPSILSYGYYSDYESLSPQFLNGFYNQRSVYISDATINSSANSYSGSVPRYANWAGPTTASDCGQHWYRESAASPGRANNGSNYDEAGRVGSTPSFTTGTRTSRSGGCDLVFSSAMVQDGKTFSRDALLSSGAGPKFNQPVFTMWGYNDGDKRVYNSPAPAVNRYYRGDTMTNTTIFPAIAPADLVLPKNIGTDGVPENACVYTGPTRVKLNGNGTATITSPTTRTKNSASDSACYPPGSISTSGIVGWIVDYRSVGGGTLLARNLGTVPTAGWPANQTKSTQTPAAGNQVFYLPAGGSTDVTQHPDTSTAGTGCSSTVKYSSANAAACAWTNFGATNDATAATGWSTYTNSVCSTAATTPTDRQSFECEYGKLATNAQPSTSRTGGQYKLFRDSVIADLTANDCPAGSTDDQASCINDLVASKFTTVNNSARRYTATSTAGTAVTTSVVTGTTATSPTGTDPFFVQPTPAKETLVRTPITTTVRRETYDSSKKVWNTGVPAFTFTTTQSDYTYVAARGASYFPNPNDVTMYGTGTNASGATAGSSGVNQPGDLYVDGKNKGKVSLVADNDVVVTGDITNPTGYTPDTDALSIAAARDVRNYHPVKCADQDATDINNTSAGWCPNDITGLTSSSLINSNGTYANAAPAKQYVNMDVAADRNIEAAVFALSGSFRTDNYNRGDAIGYLNVKGGVYQSFRGGNGVITGTSALSGTTLQYKYVDLQRAELPYVPPASSGNYSRPWDVVSISAGPS